MFSEQPLASPGSAKNTKKNKNKIHLLSPTSWDYLGSFNILHFIFNLLLIPGVTEGEGGGQISTHTLEHCIFKTEPALVPVP